MFGSLIDRLERKSRHCGMFVEGRVGCRKVEIIAGWFHCAVSCGMFVDVDDQCLELESRSFKYTGKALKCS